MNRLCFGSGPLFKYFVFLLFLFYYHILVLVIFILESLTAITIGEDRDLLLTNFATSDPNQIGNRYFKSGANI